MRMFTQWEELVGTNITTEDRNMKIIWENNIENNEESQEKQTWDWGTHQEQCITCEEDYILSDTSVLT